MIGREVQAVDFNARILSHMLMNTATPVYTIHAEVEGIACHHDFDDLLTRAADAGITFCTLGELLPDDITTLPTGGSFAAKYPAERDGSAVSTR